MGPARRYFTAPRLDRAARLREEPETLASKQGDAAAAALPVAAGRVAIRRSAGGLELGWIPAARTDQGRAVFLGLADDGAARFSVSVTDAEGERLAAEHQLEFRSLRTLASFLDGESASVGAYALAMHLWLANHRFCGACGARTEPDQAGFRLVCEACGKSHFPRLDPAIIVSVRAGERCLLGRQASWPARRYSVLAGFVEPGEALEDAVRREVEEEAGVRVTAVSYRGSQPWPFPASLMIGFTARAAATEIILGDELEDVRWFEPEDLLLDLAAGRVLLPPASSISRFLVDEWLVETTGRSPETWAEPVGA